LDENPLNKSSSARLLQVFKLQTLSIGHPRDTVGGVARLPLAPQTVGTVAVVLLARPADGPGSEIVVPDEIYASAAARRGWRLGTDSGSRIRTAGTVRTQPGSGGQGLIGQASGDTTTTVWDLIEHSFLTSGFVELAPKTKQDHRCASRLVVGIPLAAMQPRDVDVAQPHPRPEQRVKPRCRCHCPGRTMTLMAVGSPARLSAASACSRV